MTSFALSSFTQSFSCSHENLATWLDTRDEYCVECHLEQEGSIVERALNLYETNRVEQESEPAQSLVDDDVSGHDWCSYTEALLGYNSIGEPIIRREFIEPVYDITNRLPSWLFLGKHVYPMFQQDELNAYLALPSTDTVCNCCHLQINRFMGCLNYSITYHYDNPKYRYRIT